MAALEIDIDPDLNAEKEGINIKAEMSKILVMITQNKTKLQHQQTSHFKQCAVTATHLD